jgi:hypothetical protein
LPVVLAETVAFRRHIAGRMQYRPVRVTVAGLPSDDSLHFRSLRTSTPPKRRAGEQYHKYRDNPQPRFARGPHLFRATLNSEVVQ